jgi:hypothetical protein
MTTRPRKPAPSRSGARAHAADRDGAGRKLRRIEEGAEDTVDDVLHAFRKGRDDAIDAAERTVPVVKRAVSKGTYMFCYYMAFGAVYAAELAMSAVPEDSVIRSGFKDGAAAATDSYAHQRSLRDTFGPNEAVA